MYLDRMTEQSTDRDNLLCQQCKEILGKMIVYEKEDRPAFRLFVGAVTKKITKSNPSSPDIV